MSVIFDEEVQNKVYSFEILPEIRAVEYELLHGQYSVACKKLKALKEELEDEQIVYHSNLLEKLEFEQLDLDWHTIPF